MPKSISSMKGKQPATVAWRSTRSSAENGGDPPATVTDVGSNMTRRNTLRKHKPIVIEVGEDTMIENRGNADRLVSSSPSPPPTVIMYQTKVERGMVKLQVDVDEWIVFPFKEGKLVDFLVILQEETNKICQVMDPAQDKINHHMDLESLLVSEFVVKVGDIINIVNRTVNFDTDPKNPGEVDLDLSASSRSDQIDTNANVEQNMHCVEAHGIIMGNVLDGQRELSNAISDQSACSASIRREFHDHKQQTFDYLEQISSQDRTRSVYLSGQIQDFRAGEIIPILGGGGRGVDQPDDA